jgi:hypothetical protein
MGFHCDDNGDYVAELSCGHGQHVRHQPPFQFRPWVIDPEERANRIGAASCERGGSPTGKIEQGAREAVELGDHERLRAVRSRRGRAGRGRCRSGGWRR